MSVLPSGPFSIIVSDPPWTPAIGRTCSRAVQKHYETMSLKDIKELPVPDIAARDSLLFLWATVPMLRQALDTMDAWGFKYRSHGVWVKPTIGTGMWFRNRHEVFLLGRKGKGLPCPRPAPFEGVIEAPRGRHSEKPEALQEMIERAYSWIPGSRRLEMFARRRRIGWTAWGNELEEVT